MEDYVIETKGLSLKAGHRYLLNHIDWQVKQGEHWLIFGENGCGKTTLLSILAGFKQQSSGTAKLFGETYTAHNVLTMRQQIGWVSSSFFDKHLSQESALQIVLSGLFGTFGIGFGITAADIRRVKVLLRELHVEDKINTPYYLLSKGEQQNVLIARALIASPPILVLDEPSTGLDVYAREQLKNTVQELAMTQEVTILYVTHYPEEVRSFMNKTLLLKGGNVFAQGDTEAMITKEKISALIGASVDVSRTTCGNVQMTMHAPSKICGICYPQKGDE